jgi:hypothetical protein
MPRNVRPLGWREKHKPLPQDDGRTQESLDAEARVREHFEAAPIRISYMEEAANLTNDDWIALDQRRKFVSPSFGQLDDVEENRLAAKARDEMGWPFNLMSGADKDHISWRSCGLTIRQMAAVKYDPAVHKQLTDEENERIEGREYERDRVNRNLHAFKGRVLPP